MEDLYPSLTFSSEPASAHPASTNNHQSLASSFGLPDEADHQIGLSALGTSSLSNGTPWLTDWYPELPVALTFIDEGYNIANSSNNSRVEGFQGHSSNQIKLGHTNRPPGRAPRPMFISDQVRDMITNQHPEQISPSNRPAAHHSLQQQPGGHTSTDSTDLIDNVTTSDFTWKIEDYHHVPALSQQIYSVMCVHFATLNADNGFHQAFTNKPFPTFEVTAAFIQAYFEHFQPLFPIIHQPTFNPQEAPWILTLAVVVIGSRYSALGLDSAVLYLHEFLRRSINLWIAHNAYKNERGFASDPPSHLSLAQATVLNQIGMMFSGSMEMAKHAQKNMSHLALLCKKASDPSKYQSDCSRQVPEEWETWVYVESYRRLAYLAWLVDCQLALFFDLPTTVPIDLLQIPMPSSQTLWAAESQDSWVSDLAMASDPSVSYSLRQALDELYLSRKVPNHCTDLTRLLLIVGVYFDQQRGPDACVYLDVLRRDEDEMIASDRLGWLALEHNHITSLLIHLPLRELMAFSGWRVSEAERSEAEVRLAHWVKSEGAKARLVVYHAAKVYSCIRERPFGDYSGTMAFLTATLAIWAVTMSVDFIAQPLWPPAEDHSFGQSRLKILRFDRYTDGSTIIDWVSGKENIRPYLSGIGALEGSNVAPLLIRESVRVLRRKLTCMFSDAVSRVLQFHFESRDYIAMLV
ncbi:C2H2 type zinc finger domain-containing protein [Fusarium bulbicola]|nr:C2H2 type zinc finger domain-containing protein [Fusarium bulbicola]